MEILTIIDELEKKWVDDFTPLESDYKEKFGLLRQIFLQSENVLKKVFTEGVNIDIGGHALSFYSSNDPFFQFNISKNYLGMTGQGYTQIQPKVDNSLHLTTTGGFRAQTVISSQYLVQINAGKELHVNTTNGGGFLLNEENSYLGLGKNKKAFRYFNNSTPTDSEVLIEHDDDLPNKKYVDTKRDLKTAPISPTDVGEKGDIRFTENGLYVCIATDTWIKTQLENNWNNRKQRGD